MDEHDLTERQMQKLLEWTPWRLLLAVAGGICLLVGLVSLGNILAGG